MEKEFRKTRIYSEEEKESLLKRILPPNNESITYVSKDTGISISTLSTWKNKLLKSESNKKRYKKELTSKEKFLMILDTYTMNEAELSAYCKNKGIYVLDIKQWEKTFINSMSSSEKPSKELKEELKNDKKTIKYLKRDLLIKEKALAERATLLVLRKKLNAIWEETRILQG